MWLGRSQQKSTTSSVFDVNTWSDTAALVAKATAAGFTGYATAAEPFVGVVSVVSIVGVVGVLGIRGVLDAFVVAVPDLNHNFHCFLLLKSQGPLLYVRFKVLWLRRTCRVHESAPRDISTCNLQGFVAPEGVSSARERPEGDFDM